MRFAILTRQKSTDEGTFGNMASDTGVHWHSLELPWRDNATNLSCAPLGDFHCRWKWSEKHGRSLYHLMDVPIRDVLEIHAFNLAGDILQGFVAESKGCIGLGKGVAVFKADTLPAGTKDQKGIVNSASALAEFEECYNEKGTQVDFILHIKEAVS